MNFEGAVIKEQGVTFGIVVVRRHVLSNSTERREVVSFAESAWGPIPIVLMAQDSRGVPTYWGRPDIVRFLSSIDPRRIPWQRWTVAA